jgi:hypothetical protein
MPCTQASLLRQLHAHKQTAAQHKFAALKAGGLVFYAATSPEPACCLYRRLNCIKPTPMGGYWLRFRLVVGRCHHWLQFGEAALSVAYSDTRPCQQRSCGITHSCQQGRHFPAQQ